MLPVNMFNNINMDFVQAFNPLYAVPIVAVIICAVIVYALGFKSPVQPPSFEGIEEEKKYSRKRKTKDSQKGSKPIQNGKVNGIPVGKGSAPSGKKKESVEKHVSEKSSSEKSNEKKAAKKSRVQTEKKLPQEKIKETFPQDDPNEEGWVQLLSKKGRKNRKKEDITVESQANATIATVKAAANKSDDKFQVEESPKKNVELQNVIPVEQKQAISAAGKENVASTEKPKLQITAGDASKLDSNVEKQQSKELAAKGTKVLEEGSKSKKKKKKNPEPILVENAISAKETSSTISDPPMQVMTEVSAPKISPIVAAVLQDNSSKLDVNQSVEMKSTNVAFDELAGLYPEAKEQKKKKKARRDH